MKKKAIKKLIAASMPKDQHKPMTPFELVGATAMGIMLFLPGYVFATYMEMKDKQNERLWQERMRRDPSLLEPPTK